MPRFKDFYQVLGIPPRSHARTIEETYWEQAHELHKVPTRKAAQRLRAINEAYEVLGSPHRRAEYDTRWRQASNEQAQGEVRPGLLHSFVNLLGKAFRPD